MKKDWLWFLTLIPVIAVLCIMECNEYAMRKCILGRWYIWLYGLYVLSMVVFLVWWWREYKKRKDD